MTSSRLARDNASGAHAFVSSVMESLDDTGRPVAIQWQNSDHFGSLREGASGSVMVMVYVMLVVTRAW